MAEPVVRQGADRELFVELVAFRTLGAFTAPTAKILKDGNALLEELRPKA